LGELHLKNGSRIESLKRLNEAQEISDTHPHPKVATFGERKSPKPQPLESSTLQPVVNGYFCLLGQGIGKSRFRDQITRASNQGGQLS